MPEKKSNHRVNVVRITELFPHSNADTLELVRVGGYQVVVKKGDFKPGDLAIYIQPDSVVPQTAQFYFIWKDRLELDGTVREKYRRITVRRFRKEWSEGVLLPVPFVELTNGVAEGDDLSDYLGITHYDPDEGKESTTGTSQNAPRRRYPKSLKGWFFYLLSLLRPSYKSNSQLNRELIAEMGLDIPVYDVEAFKNYIDAFVPGEQVIVTEKVHGSNARFVFLDGKQYAGSRKLWKAEKSDCVWRKALEQNSWIEKWCRAHEGEVLYGEVLPTQGEPWTYGTKDGEVKLLCFDVFTKEGTWRKPFTVDNGEINPLLTSVRQRVELAANPMVTVEVPSVPILYYGPFNLDLITKLVDGPSEVLNAKNIREGVVITPVNERHVFGLGRLQLKLVSNAFLEKS